VSPSIQQTPTKGSLVSSNSRGTALLNRAFAAGAALTAGVVAMTGLFVAHISQSYAATHPSSTVTNQDQSGNGAAQTGGGQLSVPQQNQAPVGGSHGS
jgi:hypothetical protein